MEEENKELKHYAVFKGSSADLEFLSNLEGILNIVPIIPTGNETVYDREVDKTYYEIPRIQVTTYLAKMQIDGKPVSGDTQFFRRDRTG